MNIPDFCPNMTLEECRLYFMHSKDESRVEQAAFAAFAWYMPEALIAGLGDKHAEKIQKYASRRLQQITNTVEALNKFSAATTEEVPLSIEVDSAIRALSAFCTKSEILAHAALSDNSKSRLIAMGF